MANHYGIQFFETSAKMNINVDEAFLSISKDIVTRLKVNPDHYGSEGGGSSQVRIKDNIKNKQKAANSSCC